MYIPIVIEPGDWEPTCRRAAERLAELTGIDVHYRHNGRLVSIGPVVSINSPVPNQSTIAWTVFGEIHCATVDGWSIAVGPCSDGLGYGFGVRATGRRGTDRLHALGSVEEAKAAALQWLRDRGVVTC